MSSMHWSCKRTNRPFFRSAAMKSSSSLAKRAGFNLKPTPKERLVRLVSDSSIRDLGSLLRKHPQSCLNHRCQSMLFRSLRLLLFRFLLEDAWMRRCFDSAPQLGSALWPFVARAVLAACPSFASEACLKRAPQVWDSRELQDAGDPASRRLFLRLAFAS